MSRRAYTGPQGKLQRELYARARAQPRALHAYPAGTAERLAVRRMAEKGLIVQLFDQRWHLKTR